MLSALCSCRSNEAHIAPNGDDLITVTVVNVYADSNSLELGLGVGAGVDAAKKVTVGAKAGIDASRSTAGAYRQTKMPRHLINKVFDNPEAWLVVINPDGTLRIESRPPVPTTPPVPPLSEVLAAAKAKVLSLQENALANPRNAVANKAGTLLQLLQACRIYLNVTKDDQDASNPKFTAADCVKIGKKRVQSRAAMLSHIAGSGSATSTGWPQVTIDELRSWQDGLFDALDALKSLTEHPECKRGLVDRLAAPSSRLESEARVWSTQAEAGAGADGRARLGQADHQQAGGQAQAPVQVGGRERTGAGGRVHAAAVGGWPEARADPCPGDGPDKARRLGGCRNRSRVVIG